MNVANHIKQMSKAPNDQTRCDNIVSSAGVSPGHYSSRGSAIALPAESSESSEGHSSDTSSSSSTSETDITIEPRLSRRPRGDSSHLWFNETPVHLVSQPACTSQARDMVPVQTSWRRYLNVIASLFQPRFWKFYLSLHTQSTTAIDAALQAARNVFIPSTPHDLFPSTKRSLYLKIEKTARFWSEVKHTVKIDLTPCGVNQALTFNFIDPIWGWIMAARRLCPSDMFWQAKIQTLRHSGERVYGGGIQYGKVFAEACRTCPPGTYPMAFTLHWDGTQAHGQNASPIVVGVANVNGQSTEAQTCIAYMPTPQGMGAEWHSNAVAVKFYIRQQCVSAILKVMEDGSVRGVRVQLPDKNGSMCTKMLFPRLLAMNLDQPEAQLYFGLKNKQSCSKCIRRKGRSAHRVGKPQSGKLVNLLYRIYSLESASEEIRTRASEKLSKYGFNPKRRCQLTDVADRLLVRLPGEDAVFPSVDERDRYAPIP